MPDLEHLEAIIEYRVTSPHGLSDRARQILNPGSYPHTREQAERALEAERDYIRRDRIIDDHHARPGFRQSRIDAVTLEERLVTTWKPARPLTDGQTSTLHASASTDQAWEALLDDGSIYGSYTTPDEAWERTVWLNAEILRLQELARTTGRPLGRPLPEPVAPEKLRIRTTRRVSIIEHIDQPSVPFGTSAPPPADQAPR